jgi:hypothetical protein
MTPAELQFERVEYHHFNLLLLAYLLKYVIVRVKERLKERYYAGKTVVQLLYNCCTTVVGML